METKAIIFDFDGVILDSFVVLPAIYKVIKKEFKLEVPDEALETGDFYRVDWKENLKQLGVATPQALQQAVKIYQREYAKREQHVKPFKGIEAVLATLATQYQLAIVSNSFGEIIEAMLNKFELRKYFGCVVGADKGPLKPDPTLFRLCLEHLKVKPEAAVYIGDMEEDVLAGRNAQLKKVIVVTYGFHSETRLRQAKPDILISTPEDILEAVK